ncbi:MAG: phosphoribosylanthranilate isomerase [Anaerolineae bacterium]|jgi:phosphoribosylanthranilate isomerase
MTQVKICGLTNLQDALIAVEAGADLLGFIFYPPSPRAVTPARARAIVETVRNAGFPVRLVGVFVDEPPEDVRQTVSRCGLDYAQLHGAESPREVAALMDDGIAVIKAFRVRHDVSPGEIARFRATAYLLDAYVAGRPGGAGRTFDWQLAVQAARLFQVLLAGGLTPDNVAQAVRTVHPWGVDVASGVEAAPGRKDPDQVRRFVAAVKRADQGDSP